MFANKVLANSFCMAMSWTTLEVSTIQHALADGCLQVQDACSPTMYVGHLQDWEHSIKPRDSLGLMFFAMSHFTAALFTFML
ncbi:hypothetical protein BH11VER1_BH11VER1_01240 [soil metagenome]